MVNKEMERIPFIKGGNDFKFSTVHIDSYRLVLELGAVPMQDLY